MDRKKLGEVSAGQVHTKTILSSNFTEKYRSSGEKIPGTLQNSTGPFYKKEK